MVVIKKLTFQNPLREVYLVYHQELNEYEVFLGGYEPLLYAIGKGYFTDLQTAVKMFYNTAKLYKN